ncbi:MASE3 domain-containing protein [Clostridiaceae bacterium 35-E11]
MERTCIPLKGIDSKHFKKLHTTFYCISILMGFIYLGHRDFLLFHSIIEMITILIALTMTVIALNTYQINKDHKMIFLGIAYGFVASLDLIHVLSYKGMGVFVEYTANLPTQLWVMARYMESFSLLIVLMLPNKKFSFARVFYTYFMITVFLLGSVFYWSIFPDCYLNGSGLTDFKVISEYIIVIILIVALFHLITNRKNFSKQTTTFLFLSLVATMISEICFVFYISVYDLSNIIGHIFKLISFYFIYMTLVKSSLQEPYYSLHELNKLLYDKTERLKDSQEQYSKLIEFLPDAIFVHANNKITLANPAALKLTGITDIDQIIGVPLEDILKLPRKYKETLGNRIEKLNRSEAQAEFMELQLISKDGKIIDVEVGGASFEHQGKMQIVSIIRDITERKRAEKLERNLERKQILLEKVQAYDELRASFFSTVSHEFKTPLNIILGAVQLLTTVQKDVTKSHHPPFANKYLKMMKQNCNRLLKLINNLVDITKIESGFMEMHLKNYNIVSVVEDITLSTAEYVTSKGISLVFDTNIEERIIACDAEKLERVLLNLLSNAIKFTPPEGTITVNIWDKEESVLISVKDTGIGIPENMLETVFDRFKQVASVSKRNQEGSGIGLSLVKSIITLHGGRISVKSEMNKGSEFLIELPARFVDDCTSFDEIAVTTRPNVESIRIEFSDIYS